MLQQQVRDEALKVTGYALIVAVAVAARWRRLALSVSTPEWDAAKAEIITDLMHVELEQGQGASWPLVKRHKNPKLPDYPWAWFAAATCDGSDHNLMPGIHAVHEAEGYAPDRKSAHHAAAVAAHALLHGGLDADDESDEDD